MGRLINGCLAEDFVAAGRVHEKRPFAKFTVRLRAVGNLSSPVDKKPHPRTINSRVQKVVGSTLPSNRVSGFTRVNADGRMGVGVPLARAQPPAGNELLEQVVRDNRKKLPPQLSPATDTRLELEATNWQTKPDGSARVT